MGIIESMFFQSAKTLTVFLLGKNSDKGEDFNWIYPRILNKSTY